MGLVHEVEPLFGPMPDFEATLRRNLARGSALTAVGADGCFAGGMLLGGRAPADRWINWLAVRRTSRGGGLGAALVAKALELSGPPATISLHTFGEDNPDGAAARQLYLRFGFEPREMVANGPEGGSRQLFVLTRR